MKKIFFRYMTGALVLFGLMDQLSAKSVELGFQTGKVIAAEFTSAPLQIGELDSSPYPHSYKKNCYAVIALKMHPRRSISPLDYNLTINGVTASCIAAACNNEPFVSNPAVLYPESSDTVRMVFIFDGSKVKGSGQPFNGVLRPNLNSRKTVSFKITDLGSKQITDIKNIPDTGLLK